MGSAILYRSVDGHCRRSSELLQGRASPLDFVVDGHRMEILEMHFHRPWGKENLRRVGAELFVRTDGPAPLGRLVECGRDRGAVCCETVIVPHSARSIRSHSLARTVARKLSAR